jgi:4-amino-4-deoxy-L-arabinose transferase-like glycosyltransferase
VTPVFTGLEYVAFSLFGVGTWQARTVPALSGLAAVLLIAIGLRSTAGTRAAIVGAILLATNYVFVMWNRAALMESTMTAFIVASWCGYALSRRWPVLGLVAGAAVVAAWFTKASAAFFVAALLLDAGITLILCFFRLSAGV